MAHVRIALLAPLDATSATLVAVPYNYVRSLAPEIGVRFRHFRRIAPGVRNYADFVTNAHQWERLVMIDTISPLRDKGSASWKLIERWSAEG